MILLEHHKEENKAVTCHEEKELHDDDTILLKLNLMMQMKLIMKFDKITIMKRNEWRCEFEIGWYSTKLDDRELWYIARVLEIVENSIRGGIFAYYSATFCQTEQGVYRSVRCFTLSQREKNFYRWKYIPLIILKRDGRHRING